VVSLAVGVVGPAVGSWVSARVSSENDLASLVASAGHMLFCSLSVLSLENAGRDRDLVGDVDMLKGHANSLRPFHGEPVRGVVAWIA